MSGILYGVGVGPGDPELMTLKAVRLIRENDVIALPGSDPAETTAYKIAAGAVPEIEDKELVSIPMPMTRDREELERYHRMGAKLIESYLEDGKNVVFLTLGDVTIYSSFAYLKRIVEEDGWQCEMINGIPSFCAAAASLGTPLGLGDEQILIDPAMYGQEIELPDRGTLVLMKPGSRMRDLKAQLKQGGRDAMMVENCGMENERICRCLDEIPDAVGYYSLIISQKTGGKDS